MAVQKIILDIQAKVKKAQQDIDKLKGKTKGLNKEVGTTATLMKKAATAMAAFASIGAIATAIRNMVRLNVEFEKTLTNVLTLLDATAKVKFREFLDVGALRTMRQYGLEIADVNKALFDTISAGIKAGNSIKFLDTAAKLAVGGVTDLSSAVRGMTAIMNAYNLSIEDANRVASAFFSAQKFGVTTVGELVQSIGQIAPIAKTAGIGFEELLAAMALLTQKGLSTDIAATALRATITSLIDTTEESKKVFKDMNIETGIAAIRANGLRKTLGQVGAAVEENANLLTQFITNVRALNAVAAFATKEGLAGYDEILKFIITDTGEVNSLTEALELQMKTMGKQADVTRAAWKEYRIELFEGIGGTLLAKSVTAALTAVLINATETMRGYTNTITEPIGAVAAMIALANATKDVNDELDKMSKKFEIPAPDVPSGNIVERIFGTEEEMVSFNEMFFTLLGEMQRDVVDIEKETQEELLNIRKTSADAELEIELRKQEGKIAIAKGAFGLAQGLAGENFGVQKILAIAESLISTFLAGQLAYASQIGIPIVGPILAASAKRLAIRQGLANTAIIAGIALAGFKEGGFTGSGDMRLRDKDGPITGWTHKNEFVFDEPTTQTLRPFFEDIRSNRIDIHGLAALTRRGTMRMMPKLNADLLERQVEKIYKKMSEEQPEKATIIYTGNGYVKKIGNTTINVNT